MDDIGCRVFSQLPMPIIIHPSPVANFNIMPDENNVSVATPDVEFINTSTVLQNNTYYWNIGNIMQSTALNASYQFYQHGFMYITLVATNEFGCTDTITKVVNVKNEYGLWVPNSFTPNGDGLNDFFRAEYTPYGLDLSYFKMEIFDRWGERLFNTADYTLGWTGNKNNNGEPMKDDVYVYKIQYKTADGIVKQKTGHVTLIK
jgi:gliding motility-associated-like protein